MYIGNDIKLFKARDRFEEYHSFTFTFKHSTSRESAADTPGVIDGSAPCVGWVPMRSWKASNWAPSWTGQAVWCGVLCTFQNWLDPWQPFRSFECDLEHARVSGLVTNPDP